MTNSGPKDYPKNREGPMPKTPKATVKGFNLAEAKARLSLSAETPSRPKRTPGVWKGRIWIAPDFDQVDAELARLMEEGLVEPSG